MNGLALDSGEFIPSDELNARIPQSKPDNWQQYATEREETAQAVIERHRREIKSLLNLLAKDRGELQALRAQIGQGEPDVATPGPWFVRRLERDGELRDCFVSAPDCQGFAYDAEILGDDEYRDDLARKLADCELIVAAVNAYRARALAYTHQAPQQKPMTDEQQIAEALRKHGFALVKTATGYDVMKLGPCIAHDIGEKK